MKQDTDIEETNIVNILQGKLEPFVKDGDSISITTENRRKATELPTKIFRRSTKIIPSPNLSVYTDGFIPSVIPSVYTDRICPSVYTDGFADGVYSSSGNTQRHGDVRRFYRRTLPRDSN
jgi:hypothetical protein